MVNKRRKEVLWRTIVRKEIGGFPILVSHCLWHSYSRPEGTLYFVPEGRVLSVTTLQEAQSNSVLVKRGAKLIPEFNSFTQTMRC